MAKNEAGMYDRPRYCKDFWCKVVVAEGYIEGSNEHHRRVEMQNQTVLMEGCRRYCDQTVSSNPNGAVRQADESGIQIKQRKCWIKQPIS